MPHVWLYRISYTHHDKVICLYSTDRQGAKQIAARLRADTAASAILIEHAHVPLPDTITWYQ